MLDRLACDRTGEGDGRALQVGETHRRRPSMIVPVVEPSGHPERELRQGEIGAKRDVGEVPEGVAEFLDDIVVVGDEGVAIALLFLQGAKQAADLTEEPEQHEAEPIGGRALRSVRVVKS